MAARQVGSSNNQNKNNANENERQLLSLQELAFKHKYEFFHLKNLVNKQLRYNHHLTILKIHQSKQTPTVPYSIDYNHFPVPFFNTDQSYVDKHNNLIREFQKKTMELMQEYIEEQLMVIQNRMIQEKDKISNISYINLDSDKIDDIIGILRSMEEKKLTKTFMLNQRRAEKTKNTPFLVSNKQTDYTDRQDASGNHSLNQSYSDNNIQTNSTHGSRVYFDETTHYSRQKDNSSAFMHQNNRFENGYHKDYNDSGVDLTNSSSFFSKRFSQQKSNSLPYAHQHLKYNSNPTSSQLTSHTNNDDTGKRTPRTNVRFKTSLYSTPSDNLNDEYRIQRMNVRTPMRVNLNSNFQAPRKKNKR
jgi:hypothetical protein